jgi:hypothetical protein
MQRPLTFSLPPPVAKQERDGPVASVHQVIAVTAMITSRAMPAPLPARNGVSKTTQITAR